jgi:membrane-associated phospholipid phosphatase
MAVFARARPSTLLNMFARGPLSPDRNPVYRFVFEVLLLIPAYFAYHLVRGAVSGRVDDAFTNAYELMQLEQGLGIAWEVSLQEAILGHQVLVDLFNAIYIYGHIPMIGALALFIFFFRREAFAKYRNAFLLSGGIGLIFFVTLPMAPPRLVPDAGVVDTVTMHSEAYRVLQPPAFVNQFAAMPSLHFGWNLLLGLAVFETTRSWYARGLALLMPVAMLAGILFTGNHYILDAAVGGIIALTALYLANLIHRRAQVMHLPAFLF